ncbi:MAG TPA: PIG-L deacetylase family protein [Nocardioidaceae bacterium]|nr:PIG-L deacetylase family protein [Nocardioidaceae bacterium]
MSSDASPSRAKAAKFPRWESVLAVVAHPDDESFGLGAVLDAFIARGSRVAVLCLTEGESSTMGTGINLARARREELATASKALGVTDTVMHHHPDGALSTVWRHVLAGEVIDEVGAVRADGLLVFDATGVTGHPDHRAATRATLLAADVLDLPVLAWTLPGEIAERLNEELGGSAFIGCAPEQIDLRITVDRTRQVAASKAHHSQAGPSSPLWRRLDLLGDTEHLRWLRHPRPAAAQG